MIKVPETQEEINEAVSDYTNLLNNNGWKRFVSQLDANIELLQKQLENGVENEDYDMVKRVRDKLKLLREMRDTPESMLNRLTSPKTTPANPDPFDTADDIQKRRKVDK